jgi:activator of HSP90 ATPase
MMKEGTGLSDVTHAQSRRQMISKSAITLAALAFGTRASTEAQQPAMQELPGTAAHRTRTTLHYQSDLKANPQRIYEVLLDSTMFAACTGLPAEIDPKAGGAFSLFSHQIEGRNVELLLNQRIVQAWRPTHWDPGVYSIVRFELKLRGAESTLVLDHTGFPEGLYDHLDEGWRMHYLDTLKKYFA